MITLASIALVLMLFLGTPVFVVILGASMLGFYSSDVDLAIITGELYRIAETPLLVALPLFTLAGYILSKSKTSERLLKLTQVFFGWMPSSLAIVSLLSCAIFTAFTGASGVTIVALGGLLFPALIKEGYGEKLSLGLVTTTGCLGLLLPPSVPLILYGIIVQQMNLGVEISIKQLFLAGLLPALLMIVMLAVWLGWTTRHLDIPKTRFSLPEAKAALLDALWELPLPIFIFAGIFGGFFALSEVAAVTALYVTVIEVFIYKEVKISDLGKIVTESMKMVGGILIILGVAMAFTNFLVDAEVPAKLFVWVKANIDSKFTFLLLLNLFLLMLGAILNIFSAIIIVVPLILPMALGYGIHPLHLGMIFLANMQIGYLTPLVGMDIFIASYRFNKPVVEICLATLPFMLILFLAVLVVTYIPWLSVWFL